MTHFAVGALFIGAFLATPAAVQAQAMPGMAMPSTATAPVAASISPPMADTATPNPQALSSDMADMPGMDGMSMGHGQGQLAAYPMTRDASGTAWQPDSAPHEGLHLHYGDWAVMTHGYATLVYDDQGGPRGDDKTFVLSHLMLTASHPLAGGVLTLRGLASLDPLMGKSGYPLLFQTGETANGHTRLIDRQHPHDLIDELAAVYSHPVTRSVSGFVYAGWAGEPALGPATYLHRFAGMANPETPIDHHWLDSTHVAFGVVTAGLVRAGWKLEASSFTGREPNQNRYDLEHPRFDSWSTRLTYNPSQDWSLQVSRGRLHSPEELEPGIDQDRTTASATYNRAWRNGNWQTVFAWGRVEMLPPSRTGGAVLDAFLLESAVERGRNTVFGRAERADKNELFPETDPRDGRIETVNKVSVGYFHTWPLQRHLAMDLGGLVSKYAYPSELDSTYGSDPTSVMLFARFKIAG